MTVLKVFARYALTVHPLATAEAALLLEGSWPAGSVPSHLSLDESIDARHAWIDEEAARLTDSMARSLRERDSPHGASDPRFASAPYLNALKLRYYFVKLLRVVAFFEDTPQPGAIDLFVERNDEDYMALFRQLCGWRGIELRSHQSASSTRHFACPPNNAWWRRAAGRFSRCTAPRWSRDGRPCVALCGARRVLDPVCAELLSRRLNVAWLYDRFAVKTWLRWRRAGVDQWVCDASKGSAEEDVSPPQAATITGSNLVVRGIDLSPAIRCWLDNSEHMHGPRQSRLWSRIDAHFSRARPHALVLDEDATPMARAAVDVARRHGVPSIVVQHGVPRVRFGFAPLAADYLFAWGESSRRRFLRWDVPAERIRVTGPTGDAMHDTGCTMQDARWDKPEPSRIIFFATTPPRDDRPDAVSFHLTTATHREMLRIVCATVAKIPHATLTIKLHPRCRDDSVFREVVREFPGLPCRIVRRVGMARLLARAACVINCTSSAGVEAARYGVPLIELIPRGSLDLLPAREWGGLGTATNADELEALLREALTCQDATPARPLHDVFAAVGAQAARRVVDELMDIVSLRSARASKVTRPAASRLPASAALARKDSSA